MDALYALHHQFAAACDAATGVVIEALSPGVAEMLRAGTPLPTAAYPLTRLHEAVYMTCAYLLLLLVGFTLKARRRPAAAPIADCKESVLQSFINEPVKVLLVLYNLAQVLLCGWMVYAALTRAHALGYGVICNAFDPRDESISQVEWVFYASKAFDFLDTVFIIARGKWSQLSFLHTYHHASIFTTYWMVNVTGYTGDVFLPLTFNAFIHLIMYTHYGLTCFKVQAWWAKYITQAQMVQFMFMIAHGVYMLAFGCAYPWRVTAVYLIYIVYMLLLFRSFFLSKYGKKGKEE